MTDLTDYTLDQYISDLLALRKANPGSAQWPVEKWSPAKGRHRAPPACVAYRVQKMQGTRVVVGNFWTPHDPLTERGDPVIRI